MLGKTLEGNEKKITALSENDYLGPLTEYVKIRLDNVEEQDIINLAVKTARLYNEAEDLSKTLQKGIKQVSNILTNQSYTRLNHFPN
jgi:hypothetical protein